MKNQHSFSELAALTRIHTTPGNEGLNDEQKKGVTQDATSCAQAKNTRVPLPCPSLPCARVGGRSDGDGGLKLIGWTGLRGYADGCRWPSWT